MHRERFLPCNSFKAWLGRLFGFISYVVNGNSRGGQRRETGVRNDHIAVVTAESTLTRRPPSLPPSLRLLTAVYRCCDRGHLKPALLHLANWSSYAAEDDDERMASIAVTDHILASCYLIEGLVDVKG